MKLTTKKYNEIRALWFNSPRREANKVLQCNYNADKTVFSWEIGIMEFSEYTNYIHKFISQSQKFGYEEIKKFLTT